MSDSTRMLTEDGKLKLTNQELNYLQNFLDAARVGRNNYKALRRNN